jgi:hypothetical protein
MWMGSMFFDTPEGASTYDDDDDQSSIAYFIKSDFMQTNWSENAVDYIPPIGFAVVAGGLALSHPILFVAGAITALGTSIAAGATYDFCVDGAALCHLFDSTTITTTTNEEEVEADNESDQFPLLKQGLSEVTFTSMEEERDHQLTLPVDDQCLLRQDPSTMETTKEALDWVQHYYPPLTFNAVKNVEFVGLNAIEFFDVFFANDAPYTFEEFQKKRQDKDIQYGQWETLENVQQPSLHSKGVCNSADPQLPLLQERILKFKAKTNSYFGPPYATTTKVQRGLVASKRLLVLESKTTLTDIPFCDRFFVMERWVVTAEKLQDDRYHASLSVFAQVFFTKKCPFESQIYSKSEETILDIAQQWTVMAQEALKLTEQTRRVRIQNETSLAQLDSKNLPPPKAEENAEEDDDDTDTDDDDTQSIEIQRIGRKQSCIMGEVPEPPKRQRSSIRRMSKSFSNYMKRSSDVRKRSASADVAILPSIL